MRNIYLVIKNNCYRVVRDKLMLVMGLIVLPIIIALGIYFGSTDDIKGKLAIVNASHEQKVAIQELNKDNDKISFDYLEESPSKTDLIKGIYLAEINFQQNEATVICYGKEDVKKSLEANLKGEVYESTADNSTVEGKIVGFLTMFLIFGSIFALDMFLSDRESGAYTRTLIGKVSFYEYIAGQILYTMLVLLTPTIIYSVLLIKVFSVNITIGMGKFIFLIALVGLLSSCFGMIICTIFKDKPSAGMGGSIIAMMTCLLGGCIINIIDNNKIIGFIRNCIPQKRLIDLTNDFNNGDLIFVLVSIVTLIVFSVLLQRKQFKNGEFV